MHNIHIFMLPLLDAGTLIAFTSAGFGLIGTTFGVIGGILANLQTKKLRQKKVPEEKRKITVTIDSDHSHKVLEVESIDELETILHTTNITA